MSLLYPFILTTLAGMSTMIGTIPIFVKIKNENRLIAASCAFASGVMICVSIFDLVPESINYLRNDFSSFLIIMIPFIAIMIGAYVSIGMDKIIDKVSDGTNLFKVGILSMIAIILHRFSKKL